MGGIGRDQEGPEGIMSCCPFFEQNHPICARSHSRPTTNKALNKKKQGDTNVKVINQAPYPQIVIIPHKDGAANDFKLSLGDQEIGFSQRKGLLKEQQQDIVRPSRPEIRPTAEALVGGLPEITTSGVQIIIHNNQRRKEALIRASEKQSLMLANLMDAMHRPRPNQTETTHQDLTSFDKHMEEVLKRQANALNELRHNVESSDPEEAFTSERLTLLEDASHRQLAILEDLVSAIQRHSI